MVLDEEELRRIHGNDERVSIENVKAGARAYTEMLLSITAA
jgi:acetylornithine deacetylase/succinyl-diaminopimelate desuccinylase-like protein